MLRDLGGAIVARGVGHHLEPLQHRPGELGRSGKSRSRCARTVWGLRNCSAVTKSSLWTSKAGRLTVFRSEAACHGAAIASR